MLFPIEFAVRNHDQTCQFPAWMTSEHRQYHNLNRSLTYHFNKAGTSLTGKIVKPIISTLINLKLITMQYLKVLPLAVTSSDGSAPTRKLKCSSVERDTGRNFSRVIAQVNYEW